MRNPELNLQDAFLLDRVQKGVQIEKKDADRLRALKLIEEVKDTKVDDDSFYLLTLVAAAKELKRRGLSEIRKIPSLKDHIRQTD